jgi:hypothetical protein
MWRSSLLGVVLAGVLAGCSLGSRSGAASSTTGNIGVPFPGRPYHSVVVRGTRAFFAGELALPLTVRCPQSGATGFEQVIRSPWREGRTIYGSSLSGAGMTFTASHSGTVRITC